MQFPGIPLKEAVRLTPMIPLLELRRVYFAAAGEKLHSLLLRRHAGPARFCHSPSPGSAGHISLDTRDGYDDRRLPITPFLRGGTPLL